MPDQSPPVFSSTPRQELERYLSELISNDVPWYEGASGLHHALWNGVQLVAIVSGFAAATIAALMKQEFFGSYGRWLLVVIPAIGSCAGSLLSVFRFREMEDLRETGRIEIQNAVDNARAQLAAVNSDRECSEIHDRLLKLVYDLDQKQHSASHTILRKPFGDT